MPAAPALGGADVVAELRDHVGREIGPIAKPKKIMVVPELPKTRSGKIVRRILRKIADPGEMPLLLLLRILEMLLLLLVWLLALVLRLLVRCCVLIVLSDDILLCR